MRVHSVEAIAIDIPLKKNFGGSTYSVLKRSTVITRLRTDEGLESEVYNGDNREHGREIVRIIREELAPLIIGEDVFATERIWPKLFALSTANLPAAFPKPTQGPCNRSIAVVRQQLSVGQPSV